MMRAADLDTLGSVRYRGAPGIWRVAENEKNISTQQQASPEEARFPAPDADQERAQDPQRAAPQGPQAHCGLSGCSFPPRARLRRRSEFREVYAHGVRVPGRHMVVFARPRTGEGGSRLGVTASRRVGGAVTRSRCRRRLRELFRLNTAVIAGLQLDVVVNARRSCAEARWSELEREFRRCLRELRSRFAASA